MSEFDKARKKIKYGDHLTTVDFFVNAFKSEGAGPGNAGYGDPSQSEYLKNKAAERKLAADEEEKKRRSGR